MLKRGKHGGFVTTSGSNQDTTTTVELPAPNWESPDVASPVDRVAGDAARQIGTHIDAVQRRNAGKDTPSFTPEGYHTLKVVIAECLVGILREAARAARHGRLDRIALIAPPHLETAREAMNLAPTPGSRTFSKFAASAGGVLVGSAIPLAIDMGTRNAYPVGLVVLTSTLFLVGIPLLVINALAE